MEQIERIKLMEQHLDKATQAVKALSDALDLYSEAVDSIEAIDDYLASDEWEQDFNDSEAGRLPKDLKCGVLSEDGIWDVVDTSRELNCQMLELVATMLATTEQYKKLGWKSSIFHPSFLSLLSLLSLQRTPSDVYSSSTERLRKRSSASPFSRPLPNSAMSISCLTRGWPAA